MWDARSVAADDPAANQGSSSRRLAPSERTVSAEYRYAITVPIDLIYGTDTDSRA